MRAAALLLFFAACHGEPVDGDPAGRNDGTILIPADADDAALLDAIDRGLATPGKGPDLRRFVLIRSLDRHDPRLPDSALHFVVGAGARMPEGSIRVRRSWSTSGEVDGSNEELQNYAVAIGIERGAPRPFSPAVVEMVSRICGALARPEFGLELHPDAVVAMGEVPFTNPHTVDAAERRLAAAARTHVPVPLPDGSLTIAGEHTVAYERRDTTVGRQVGLMLRRGFDGDNRGMLFVYPHRANRGFWMRNCLVPIDIAYIKNGEIVQIETMEPKPGVPTGDLPRFESVTPVRYVLEMPGGWFRERGVERGAAVEGLPE